MGVIVVTGVSTGIGWGITKVLVGAGHQVFGSVRREADAERLKAEFGDRFTPLLFDVTDERAVRAAVEPVRTSLNGRTLLGLVNNAGVAVAGPLLELPVAELRRQLEVNLVGQVTVTQAFAPLLGIDRTLSGRPGRIVMISSVGGKRAMPFLGPYSASKFGLEGLSESLRRELMLYGIDVVIVGPASIKTPIWDKARELDIDAFSSSSYYESLGRVRDRMLRIGKAGLPPERVGELVLRVLTARSPRVRYSIMGNALEQRILALLPKRFLDRQIAKRLGLTAVPARDDDA